MKNLEQVTNLFNDPTTTKVVSTVSKDGEIHSIIAGTVIVVDDNTMAVAEVFMNTTGANLSANKKVAILGVKGMESYLINATAEKRHTEGEFFDAVVGKFAALNLPIKAIWTFTVDKIYNEGAGPDAGKQIF